MPNRLRILLTEGSSLSARQTLYALGGRHEIDILDPSPLCLCRFSRYVRRWYRCPSMAASPDGYLAALVARLQKRQYDVLLPTHEQVYLVARFHDRLRRYVGFAVPDFDALRRTQSKIEFIRLMDELRLPQPATVVLASLAELDREWDYPVFLKLAHGTAGNGVRLVRDENELRAAAEAFRRIGGLDGGEEFLVQQPAVGEQCTVQAVFRHGELLSAHSTRSLAIGQSGGPLVRESVRHSNVVEHVAKLGAYLRWHGPLFLEYFYDAQLQRPEYIECNPRIGETFNAALAGVNIAEATVQLSVGAPIEPLPPLRTGVRSHNGFMVLMNAGLEGASRRQIFAAWQAMRRGEGAFRGSENELTRPGEDLLSVIPAAWIAARVMLRPSDARRIVNRTVGNYSLPGVGAERIDAMPTATPSKPEPAVASVP